MISRFEGSAFALTLALSVLLPTPAQALPAFARKYGTSCLTCHTVFPKLNPFGEAFRRNGYHFPGEDSDYVKQEVVPMGQDAQKETFPNSVWPGTLPSSVPIALGFNGQGVLHPDKHAAGAVADNGSVFTLHDLIAEGHIWAGGNYDDHISYFGEFTFAEGGAEVEKAKIIISDFIGPKHAVNLVVGRDSATLSSFGSKSSYLADQPIVAVPVTALYASGSDSFNLGDNYNGLEVNGTVASRFSYALGINAGANLNVRSTENFYGKVGFKVGGVTFDGEGSSVPDPTKPWAETSLTVDAFAYQSNSNFADETGASQQDTSRTLGGGLRGQIGSLELNSGVYYQTHNHVQSDGMGATLLAQYNELSYVVFPWMVPAVRVEYLSVTPGTGDAAHDLRVTPGVAFLVRPNIRLQVLGQIESANLSPPGGWGPAGGSAAPTDKATTEIESVSFSLFTAF